MRIGAVDVGTNSCRLLIVEYKKGMTNKESIYEIKRCLFTTRLGEGVDKTGLLKEEAITRTIKAIKAFICEMNEYDVEKIALVGTSAVRDVSNGRILIDRIKKETGLTLRVLSGKEEAALVYSGAKPDPCQNYLLVDIGGGSTELIWQSSGQVNFVSLDIGAVRLTERYIDKPDRALENQKINVIEKEIIKELKEVFNKIDHKMFNNTCNTYGAGGTITTLASVYQGITVYESNRIHNYCLSRQMVEELVDLFSSLNLKERKEIAGLSPDRADIITAGTIILDTLMKYLELEEITVTEHGILYGLISEVTDDL